MAGSRSSWHAIARWLLIFRACLVCKQWCRTPPERRIERHHGKGVDFCREAWNLQRQGLAPNARAYVRLEEGSEAHVRIGRATDRLRRIESARRILLLLILLLAIAIVLEGAGLSVPAPLCCI